MFQRFLGIHPGERKNLLYFALLGFFWSLATASGVALSDAGFLQYVGSESLSVTFTFTALGMFGISGILSYLYNRLNIDQIFGKGLWMALIFFGGTYVLISLGISSPVFWIFFKVLCYILHVTFTSCFFTFLDQYFELQNAKRLFSLLYSAIFSGMAVAGAILFLSETPLGTLVMLGFICLSLLAALLVLKKICTTFPKIYDDHEEFAVIKTSKAHLFKAILTSPFTILFLLMSIMLQTVLVMTEFQYMQGLETAFVNSDPSRVTHFLARLYFWGSLLNIFVGIFLYGRLVQKLGLNNIVLVVPLFFCLIFGGWQFSNHIILPVMGFIAVEGVLNLLEDNNFNLLLNAVPLRLKNKIRITSESMLEPIGMLISAFLLMAFQMHSKRLGILLSIIFLALTLIMRAYYTKGIFYNLVSHLIPFNGKKTIFKKSLSSREFKISKASFLTQFFEIKENEQLFLIESALRFNDVEFLETLLKKITKLGENLKKKTLSLFEDYPSDLTLKCLPYFEFWTKQSSPLQNDLYFHLSKIGLLDIEVAEAHLKHPCPKIRGACLLTLRQKIPHSFESKKARKMLYHMLISSDESEVLIAIQILKYEHLKDFKSKVFDLLRSASFKIKKCILETLPYLLDKDDTQYAPILLQDLQKDENVPLRLQILKVLEQVADVFTIKELLVRSLHFSLQERMCVYELIEKMGTPAIPQLEAILQNTHLPDQLRLMSAQVLGRISHRHLKINFNKIVDKEIERANFYYYHYLTIQKSVPYTNLSLLNVALKNSYESVLSLIIQVQAFLNKFERSEYLIQSLKSEVPKTFSHALETLDKISSSKLYKKLCLIIEKDQAALFLKTYHSEGYPILALDNLLDRLEQTPSLINQLIVPLFKDRFNIPKSKQIKEDQNKKNLEQYTQELLEACGV